MAITRLGRPGEPGLLSPSTERAGTRILGDSQAAGTQAARSGGRELLGGTVPLSEHEQRQLEQIEQALYAEHPRFAKAVRAADPQVHYKRRVVYAGLVFAIGVALLPVGVSTLYRDKPCWFRDHAGVLLLGGGQLPADERHRHRPAASSRTARRRARRRAAAGARVPGSANASKSAGAAARRATARRHPRRR